jgi:hypothetical protein
MKQISLLTMVSISFVNPIFSQNTSIQTNTGITYTFSPKNFSFNGKSISIGKDAGKMLSVTSQSEIYIGDGAGEFIVGSTDCIGIGAKVMSNSSGYRNTAIGTNAMRFNTKWDNVAIGTEALVNNQIGESNIAIGSYALRTDQISGWNTAIGGAALRELGITGVEANYNVALGYLSQKSNRTGTRNVSVGSYSLSDGLAFSDNTAVGYFALNNTNGDYNVAVGSAAFNNSKEVSRSVAIGFQAGSTDTLGSNSVYIGYQAGSGPSSSAKSGNVFIGYRAGYGETDDNRLFIDNSGTSTPLIEGNFAADILEVNGSFIANGNTTVNGTLYATEEARFEGNFSEFIHGNNSSTSGVRIQNENSNDHWRMYVSSSTGDLRLFNNANGGGTTIVGKFDQVTGAYTTPSDKRLKSDIRLVGSVLPLLMATNINSYKFKAQKTEQRSIGVMAQEVKEIFPELVHYDIPTDSYTVDYAGFSMVALKAIQEQQKTIEKLILRIEKLENEK